MARIRKAQTAFSALNKIWQSTTYSTQTKLRIFNTNVKAVLLYGCETWKNSKYITTKLQVFVNKSLRKILRIFWPDQITNNELWKRTKQPWIDLQIRKRKWGWLGHILRKPMDDIARQALEWNPQGKRGRGRPKNTWQRTVLEEAKEVKKTWAEINPYPTAFPYGNGMVLHFYQQQESSTTKTVHKVINKGLKTYV